MLTGFQLAYNSFENARCYTAGTDATTGLQNTAIPCAQDGGKFLGLDWAIPCSDNGGVSLSVFSFVRATDNTKPRPDAVKTISVLDTKAGGSYGRWIVPDDYTQAAFTLACCAGCSAIPATTTIAPILLSGECTVAAPTLPGCVYKGMIYVPALTVGNTTFTATGYGFDANGVAIVFAPTTSTGTTVALLAAAMQTNWASETGGGTFTAVVILSNGLQQLWQHLDRQSLNHKRNKILGCKATREALQSCFPFFIKNKKQNIVKNYRLRRYFSAGLFGIAGYKYSHSISPDNKSFYCCKC
jgi:hypothetical protein